MEFINTLIPIVYIAAPQITGVTVPLILEPAVYWNVNGDRSVFGLKVGFGFYF